jgi:hypothetical protein
VLEGLLILGVLGGLGGVIVMAGVVVAGVRIVARGVHRGDGEEERDDQRAQGSRKRKGETFCFRSWRASCLQLSFSRDTRGAEGAEQRPRIVYFGLLRASLGTVTKRRELRWDEDKRACKRNDVREIDRNY